MVTQRWDETWHRLIEWTNGQGPSERLAAQVLSSEGFTGIDPSHPLGGKDGGRDAKCQRDGHSWVMAVFFPRGQKAFQEIEDKFRSDLLAAKENGAQGFVFVTNQEIRLAERKALDLLWPGRVDLFHLERITVILDRPAMHGVRKQFLGIEHDTRPDGGKGGDAHATDGGTARGGEGGAGGTIGSGGPGGDAKAIGAASLAVAGPGGRGGIVPGGPGGDAIIGPPVSDLPLLDKSRRPGAGGGAYAKGNVTNVIAIGGEGGEAARHDGRGGRGGRSGGYTLGLNIRNFPDGGYPGQGGRAPNSAGYDGKVATIKTLLRQFYNTQPAPVSPSDDHAAVPLCWLNARLEQMGAPWRVRVDEGEYEFLPATS